LVLRELEGMSYADIASIVGTNERGVEATLRRARARFRLEVAKAESDEEERAVCRRTLRLFAVDAEEALASTEASRHLRRCFRCRTRIKALSGADRLLGLIAIPVAVPRLSWPLQAVASLRARGSRMLDHVRSGEGFVAQVAPFTVSAMLVASVAAAQVVGPVRAAPVQDNPVMSAVYQQQTSAEETDAITSIIAGGTAPTSRGRSIPAASGSVTPSPSSPDGAGDGLLGLDLSDLPVLGNLDSLEDLEQALSDPTGALQGAVSDVSQTADAVVQNAEATVESVADATTATEGVDVPEVRTSRITSRIAPE
ncbi:MAG: sigma factor-like helix-turn-helix DNA-binding protein, partial [Nocardioidaceae bacterium]